METLVYVYVSDSTPNELSNEYQHGMVWMIFINVCLIVHWPKIAPASEWLLDKGMSSERIVLIV